MNQNFVGDAIGCTVDIAGQACKNPSSSPLASVRRRPKVRSMAEAPIPSVVAMLVCDQVITEMGTNKKTLIGVFDNYFSLSFPTLFQRLAIYVKLADAVGNYLFKVRVVKLKDESLIAEIGIQAQISDVSQYAELALNMGNIPVPEPGKYEFQLYAGEVFLHRVTMQAKLAQLPQGGSPSWPQQK